MVDQLRDIADLNLTNDTQAIITMVAQVMAAASNNTSIWANTDLINLWQDIIEYLGIDARLWLESLRCKYMYSSKKPCS